MKPHYFDGNVDADDINLKMAIGQGYVPSTCLLGGMVVISLVNEGQDPCRECEGPRNLCHGRAHVIQEDTSR